MFVKKPRIQGARGLYIGPFGHYWPFWPCLITVIIGKTVSSGPVERQAPCSTGHSGHSGH